MFSYADVEKLRSACATEPVVLSLYLPVPLDPAGLRGLAAEAGELMANAAGRRREPEGHCPGKRR